MPTSTKERILDVAERLFAEQGFPSTSLRDITAEAAVNLASVNYHFGSKEALLAALLDHRFRPMNDLRLERLDRLESTAGATGNPIPVSEVIRAFLAPPFEQQRLGVWSPTFLRLVGRIHAETNEQHRATFEGLFKTVRDRFTIALQKSLPHLHEHVVRQRMLFLMGSMAFAMARNVVSSGGNTADQSAILEPLIEFATGGMSAPEKPVTGKKKRKKGTP